MRAHREQPSLGDRHVAQLFVEALRAEEEAGVGDHAVAQPLAEARRARSAALLRIVEVGAQLRAVGRDQHAAVVLDVVAKQADVAELVEVDERHAAHAAFVQRRQRALADLLVDVSLVEQPLQLGAGVDAALQHAAAIQIEEAVGEHLGAAVQAALERRRAAFGFDQAAMPREQAERLDDVAIDRRLLVPQLQRVDDRVAELADAELQRAAVADQRADVQRDRILGAAESARSADRTARVPGSSSRKSNVSAATSASPYMKGSSP